VTNTDDDFGTGAKGSDGKTIPRSIDITDFGSGPYSSIEIGDLLDGHFRVVGGPYYSERERESARYDIWRVRREGQNSELEGNIIWRARSKGQNNEMAMKRLNAESLQIQQHKEEFIAECKVWVNLGQHPNVVPCLSVRVINGAPSIFSEWMEGGSLNDWIYQKPLLGPYPLWYPGGPNASLERILTVSIQFARGLGHIHRRKDVKGDFLIHQDVSPNNLLFTMQGQAKVTGIDRAAMGQTKRRFMLYHKSPEQQLKKILTILRNLFFELAFPLTTCGQSGTDFGVRIRLK
jgi:hypothetical protein